MSYSNIYVKYNESKINLINDTQNLLIYTTTTGGTDPPTIEKTYDNYCEFILTNGIKKILIIDDILEESHINNITGNSKSSIFKVFISNSCTSIEADCFKDCSNLSYISYINNFDASLTEIKASAFENCYSLDECKLFDSSNNILTIGNYAFRNCNNLYEAQLENTIIQTIGDEAFKNCSKLVSIHIPSTLTTVGSNCFLNTVLTNIYFDSNIPNSIGSNIFGTQFQENLTCYYNNNYISGGTYTSLKNIFGNNTNIVFIETNTDTVENGASFYTIINNNNNVSASIINNATTVLNSIIKKRNGNVTYNINVDYDNTLQGTDTLGYAAWSTGEIRLNPDNDSGSNIDLNNVSMSLNSVVLIHEILHIFGFGAGTIWTNLSQYDTALDNYFTGLNGIYQYNKILYNNGYNKKLNYLTREDSGGSGTMGSHTEEGYFINETYFNPQMRADSKGNVYPSLRFDIMSGYLDSENYFTGQCCGVLQDLGFTINYNSSYVYKGSISFYPNVKFDKLSLLDISSNLNKTNIDNSNNEKIDTINNINNIDFTKKSRCMCNNKNSNNETVYTISKFPSISTL